MYEEGFRAQESAARRPQTITIVSEQNKCGTWSVAAYFGSGNGAGRRRRLATCEREEDAHSIMRHYWTAI